ncbi:MAG: hypothetical protein E3J21_24240 [Anaerolineales bacterium]|nr:MAG: hypothetical protein E3J21_24240 [Anaerolineales bacterium]
MTRDNHEFTALYIKLYFDEDVSRKIMVNLRNRGYNVLHACEAEMLEKEDHEQLEFAIGQGRTVVTHNRDDFKELHKQYLDSERGHYGIIIAKRRRDNEIVIAKLLDLLNKVTASEIKSQLRYL